ncbi:MAG: hypothetical protein M0Q94_07725 [Candidatus Cloacimonetes bacterium]|nr:hypothetical protein [Candidatus Cloacimonadota bacterium]
MKYDKSNETKMIEARISASERDEAKAIAKSKGMTFQAWLGFLIKNELAKEREAFNDQASAQSFAKRLNQGEA